MIYADLYEPLDADQMDALVESIRRHGQLEPIVREAVTGTILSGYNRQRACEIAGVEPIYRDVEVRGAEALELVALANRERQLRPGQREQVIGALRAAGLSDRRIAGVLGVARATVQRVPAGPNEPPRSSRVGRDGKHYSSPNAVADRRAAVVSLFESGYRVSAIAKALDVSQSLVSNDLHAEQIDTRAPRRVRHDRPPPVDWRSGQEVQRSSSRRPKLVPPAPSPEVEHRGSRVLLDIERFLQAADEEQHLKALACQVAAARNLGDSEWLDRVETAAKALATGAQMLALVVTDEKYREAVRFDKPIDRPMLRAVRSQQ